MKYWKCLLFSAYRFSYGVLGNVRNRSLLEYLQAESLSRIALVDFLELKAGPVDLPELKAQPIYYSNSSTH